MTQRFNRSLWLVLSHLINYDHLEAYARFIFMIQGKFFEFAGVASDRIHIFGRSSDEIMGFVDHVVDFMGGHMGDPILLIADENLDIVDEATKHRTISGSHLVEIIRSRLLPEQERCLFSLIRSANDSASDIAIYKSRAHGFLPKGKQVYDNVVSLRFGISNLFSMKTFISQHQSKKHQS